MDKTGLPRWLDGLVAHALPIGFAVLTVAGGAGYAAGHAHLEGWTAAAGIPPQVFNQEIQSVVLRGVSSGVLWLWLLCLASLSVFILIFGTVDIVVDKLRERWLKKGLGGRPANPSSRGPRSSYKRRLAVLFFLAYLPVAAATLWFLAAKLLTEMPRHEGEREFLALHVAATCRPPSRFETPAPDLLASLREKGMSILSRYGWVEVRSPGLSRSVQGWLLQIQGSTLLLLTPEGVDLLHLADHPFRVSAMGLPAGVPAVVCKGKAPAGSKPVLKGESPE